MDYKAKLDKIITKISKNKEITPETSLKDLGLDSLDMVEVLMEVEEELDIQFEEEEMVNLKTVNDVYNAIERKIKK